MRALLLIVGLIAAATPVALAQLPWQSGVGTPVTSAASTMDIWLDNAGGALRITVGGGGLFTEDGVVSQ